MVSVAGDLRIFETPDVSDLLFVCSNNHFISFRVVERLPVKKWKKVDVLELLDGYLMVY